MKKSIITFFLVTVIVFYSYSQTGVIREIAGDVEIKPAGMSEYIAARVGSEVTQDTIISTGFKGSAIIAIGSTTITVRPLTRLTLAEISGSAGTEELNVNLQAGRIRVDVKPPAGTRANTTVQSPSATASVRGTTFEMDAVSLSVIDGSVGWKNSNGLGMIVSGGGSSKISSNGYIEQPIQLAIGEILPPAPVGFGMSGESINADGESIIAGSIGGEASIEITIVYSGSTSGGTTSGGLTPDGGGAAP